MPKLPECLVKWLVIFFKEKQKTNSIIKVEKDAFIKIIEIDKIEARNNQPRKKFEYVKIKELADSISNKGYCLF